MHDHDAPASSKLPGAPRVVARFGNVRVEQSRASGWVMLAFGLGIPGAILFSEYAKRASFRADPAAYLGRQIEQLADIPLWGWPVIVLGVLFLAFLTGYGTYWVLWRRVLSIDLNLGHVRFETGIWPWVRRIELGRDAFTRIELRRTVLAGTRDHGRPFQHERWELDLPVPGCTQPLHLGMWGLRVEAIAEAERFRAWLPALVLAESDSHPEIVRASANRGPGGA